MAEKVDVYLEEYTEDEFDEFMEAFTKASEMGFSIDDPLYVRVGHFTLENSNQMIRAIRCAADDEHLGFCEIHDTRKDPWELGIHLLERHRGKGVGTAALPLFLDELAVASRESGCDLRHFRAGFVAFRIANPIHGVVCDISGPTVSLFAPRTTEWQRRTP